MSVESKKSFEVKWRIENLRSWFLTRNDALYSPLFRTETLSNTGWRLSLFSSKQKAEKYICLALERDVEDDHIEQLEANYELSFLASDESPLKSKYCTSKFAPKCVRQKLIVKEAEIFQEKTESYLPGGALEVCCKLWKACSTISKGGQCLLKSVIGKKSILLDGTIDYFSKLNDIEMCNAMANFVSPHSDVSFISFIVSKFCNQNSDLQFNRVEVKCNRLNMYACELFVLDGKGQRIQLELRSSKLMSLFRNEEPCSFIPQWGYYIFLPYLKNDSLALQLSMTYHPGVESECIEHIVNNYHELVDDSGDFHPSKHQKQEYNIRTNESNDKDEHLGSTEHRNVQLKTLAEDMASLFKERLFCDTKLQTDNETFPAHRCVLSVRSPVFKKMFTTDMKEKNSGCVNVPDISSDTVRRMLQFLYTDCTGDLDMQSAKDLYIASDKYDIAALKVRCSSFMMENLCPANVCDVLVLADMHQDKNLESVAQEYVLTNDEVLYSDEWKSFMKNFSGLAAQVMYLKFTRK